MNWSEPLEWSITIEYCPWANFVLGCATLVQVSTVRWPIYQYFWLCEAAAHVMEDQSGFQGYKSFPLLGLSMACIEIHKTTCMVHDEKEHWHT